MSHESIGTGRRDLAALFEMPAAQIRSASPHAPSIAPIARDDRVGRASQRTMTAVMNPMGTRQRASSRSTLSMRTGARQSLLNGGAHLRRRQIRQAPALLMTSTIVVTPASVVCRHDHVVCAPRAIARGIGWTKEPDGRRANGRRDVQWSGIAGDHDRRGAHKTHEIRNGRRRREPRGAEDEATTSCGELLFTGSPQHERREPAGVARNAESSPKRSGGHRLLGHAAPAIDRGESACPRTAGAHDRAPATRRSKVEMRSSRR